MPSIFLFLVNNLFFTRKICCSLKCWNCKKFIPPSLNSVMPCHVMSWNDQISRKKKSSFCVLPIFNFIYCHGYWADYVWLGKKTKRSLRILHTTLYHFHPSNPGVPFLVTRCGAKFHDMRQMTQPIPRPLHVVFARSREKASALVLGSTTSNSIPQRTFLWEK